MDMLNVREESTSLEVKYMVILYGVTWFLGNVKKKSTHPRKNIKSKNTLWILPKSNLVNRSIFLGLLTRVWVKDYLEEQSDSKAVALPKITLEWVTALNSWKQSCRQLDMLSTLFFQTIHFPWAIAIWFLTKTSKIHTRHKTESSTSRVVNKNETRFYSQHKTQH